MYFKSSLLVFTVIELFYIVHHVIIHLGLLQTVKDLEKLW